MRWLFVGCFLLNLSLAQNPLNVNSIFNALKIDYSINNNSPNIYTFTMPAYVSKSSHPAMIEAEFISPKQQKWIRSIQLRTNKILQTSNQLEDGIFAQSYITQTLMRMCIIDSDSRALFEWQLEVSDWIKAQYSRKEPGKYQKVLGDITATTVVDFYSDDYMSITLNLLPSENLSTATWSHLCALP